MELIGNYASWITPELMELIKNNPGDTIPVWQPNRWTGRPEWDEARERARPGYSDNKHFFQQFNPYCKDMEGFDLVLPKIPGDDRTAMWWIVKLLPGQMQSMHFDPHLIEYKNPQRYTLFLEDWKPGHVYVWGDQYISNYKAGDFYKWKDPMCYHGCVNIGYDNRYTLQITTVD